MKITAVEPIHLRVPVVEPLPDGTLDVLVVKGLYHYAYRVPEAIKAVAPNARIRQVIAPAALFWFRWAALAPPYCFMAS